MKISIDISVKEAKELLGQEEPKEETPPDEMTKVVAQLQKDLAHAAGVDIQMAVDKCDPYITFHRK